MPVEPERRVRAAGARDEACELLRDGYFDEAVSRCVASLADNPWDVPASQVLESLVPLVGIEQPVVPASLQARSFTVGLRGAEFLHHPALFDAFATEFDDRDDVTLVVHAPEDELARVAEALAAAAEPYGEALPDVVALGSPSSPLAESGLAARLDAVLGAEVRRGAFRAVPQVGAELVAGLRMLAGRRAETAGVRTTEPLVN